MAAGLKVGDVLCGRYPIEGILGEGGMGAVYKAGDLSSKRKWAIKEMSDSFDNPQEKGEAIASFKAEADMLAELDHPNLPRITHCFSERGRQYIVMDLVEGKTIEKLLKEAPEHRLSLQETLNIASQLTAVLSFLHSHHPPIIFRDLKPANIMLTPRGVVKLIDFGIARFFQQGKKSDTRALGTPGYAAPEQYGKGQSDARTDIYAMGATLHECLTGRDPGEAAFKFQPPSQIIPSLPQSLDFVLLKSLNIDPQRRWQTVEEFGQAFIKACQPLATPTLLGPLGESQALVSGSLPAASPAATPSSLGAAASVTTPPASSPAPTIPPAGPIAAPVAAAATIPVKPTWRTTSTPPSAPSTPSAAGADAKVSPSKPSADIPSSPQVTPPKPTPSGDVSPATPARRNSVFSCPLVDFGKRELGGIYKASLTARGEVNGELHPSAPWIVCRPPKLQGQNQPFEIYVDTKKIANPGLYEGHINLGKDSLGVKVEIMPTSVGCLKLGWSIFLLCTSILPYLGLGSTLLLLVTAFLTAKYSRSLLLVFTAVALVLSLLSTTITSVVFLPYLQDIYYLILSELD